MFPSFYSPTNGLLPHSTQGGALNVAQCDGSYSHSHGVLEWSLPLVDKTNSNGTLEFSAPGTADSFYPVEVNFNMNKPFCDMKVSTSRVVCWTRFNGFLSPSLPCSQCIYDFCYDLWLGNSHFFYF